MRLLFSVLLAAILGAVPSQAQTVPAGITYQGRLTDASSAPLPDGTGYEIEVRLWSASTGGLLLWGHRYSGVIVKNGAFNLILGSGGIPISGASATELKTAFSAPVVHLGLTATKTATGTPVMSPTEILPRQQIFSAPYAFLAETAASVRFEGVLSDAIKDGEVKSADIADAAITASKLPPFVIDNSKIAPQAITPDRLSPAISLFSQQQANGTSPQAAKRGWQKRELNTTDLSIGTGITLDDANDQISMISGVYEIHAAVPYYSQFHNGGKGSRHRVGIKRVSDAAVLALSSVIEYDGEGNNGFVNAFAGGSLVLETIIVVPSGTESFELIHHIQDTTGVLQGGTPKGGTPEGADGTDSVRGFCGVKSPGSGLPEVYSKVTIKRLQ